MTRRPGRTPLFRHVLRRARASLKRPGSAAIAGAVCLLAANAGWASDTAPPATPAPRLETPRYSQLRYDLDYPTLNYSQKPTQNAFARLQEKLDKGEVKLEWKAPRGYLDSLLKALKIDKSSQVLIHSKTSLQFPFISEQTPRSLFFDDEVYVAWIPGTPIMELMAVDAQLGPVFYALENRRPTETVRFDRETLRCLNCHDSFSLQGGGVPHFMMVSTNAGIEGDRAQRTASIDTNDDTPMRFRFGGWYVTGDLGSQKHLGNIIIRSEADLDNIEALRKGNLENLRGVFDTKPYASDRSDIVALLVLQHQVTAHNLITRATYKSRNIVWRAQEAGILPVRDDLTWQDFTPEIRGALKALIDPLVRSLLNAGAMGFESPIRGNSGYDEWFQQQGPKDSKGRSLRDFDLQTRLFKYPLSYLIYSDGFEGLPDYVKQYIYVRIADVLTGRDTGEDFARLMEADRKAMLEILRDTKPAFVQATRGT